MSLAANAAPISFKTNKKIGEQFTIALNSGLNVQVVWSNGKTDSFKSDALPKSISIKSAEAEIKADADITSVYLGGNGITDLKFDVTATSIQKFYCPANELTSLDLSVCQQLTDLNCAGNKLENIKIGSEILENCDLSNNKLQKVEIPNNGLFLNTLVLSDNQLSTIDNLKNMKRLETVFCANNQLTSISFQRNKKISNVVANNNKLTTLETKGLKNLRQVWVSNNELTQLDIAAAGQMASLKADHNKLNKISWTKDCNKSVEFLDVVGNNLFFNSLPGIQNEKDGGHTVQAYIAPQNDYQVSKNIFIGKTYDDWKDEFTVNAWNEATNLKLEIKDGKNAELKTPDDYTLTDGAFKFTTAHPATKISAQSENYPGVTLSTSTFDVTETLYGKVVFNYVFNGKVIGQESQNYELGTLVKKTPCAHNNDFCSYEFSEFVVDCLHDTVDVKVTWNGPFEFSENTEDAKWYYLGINSNNKIIGYLQYIMNRPLTMNREASVSADYYWAFLGNPWNIKVVNRADEEKFLSDTPNYPQMTDNEFAWTIYAANAQKGKFLLHCDKYGYTSFTSNVIKYSGSQSQGSHLVVEKAPEYTVNYEEMVKKEVAPFFNADKTGGVLELTKEAYNKYKDEAKAAESKCNAKTYNHLKQVIKDNVTYPTAGFYRLKNEQTGKYMYAVSESDKLCTNSVEKTLETVIELRSELPPGNIYKEKKLFLLSQNKWCSAVVGPKATPNLMNYKSNFVQFLPIAPGKFAFTIASYNGRQGYEQFLSQGYYNVDEKGKVHGSEKTPGVEDYNAIWTLEEATTAEIPLQTIGDNCFGTLYAPFSVSLVNATAYSFNIEDNEGILTTLDEKIPEATPVVVISKDKKAQVNILSEKVTANESKGKSVLKGSYFPKRVRRELILGEKDGCAGFFMLGNNELGANSAYISGSSKYGDGVKFSNLPTGIENIMSDGDTVVYDLQGRRILKPQHGLYIVNGKKVFIK